ncbi:MAG: cytochrome c3 family protein [Desulfatiglandaceae bacterium]
MKNANIPRYSIYIGAAVLFATAFVCYTAFPKAPPEEPLRIILENTGGAVFFDHKRHMSENHYDITCTECHHMWDEGDTNPPSCTACHEAQGEDPMKRYDAMHLLCIGCHEDTGTASVKCAGCHMSG